MRIRCFHQWDRIGPEAWFSFSPLVFWYGKNVLGYSRCLGLSILGLATEVYWGKEAVMLSTIHVS